MMTRRFAHVVLAVMAIGVTSIAARAGSLVDPTQPTFGAPANAAVAPSEPVVRGPVLQSTVVSPERKSAVISGRQVKVGDVYEGARVVDIRPYEVLLDRGGRETRLRLAPKLAKEKGVGQ